MHPDAAKAIDFSKAQLRQYLFGDHPGTSDFIIGRDFSPGALGMAAPTQLHYTERQDGVYTKLSQGKPAIKDVVLEMLDCIPHRWVEQSVGMLRRFNPREHKALDAWIHRTSEQTAESLAPGLDCSRATVFAWRDKGLDIVYDRLQYLCDRAARVNDEVKQSE